MTNKHIMLQLPKDLFEAMEKLRTEMLINRSVFIREAIKKFISIEEHKKMTNKDYKFYKK